MKKIMIVIYILLISSISFPQDNQLQVDEQQADEISNAVKKEDKVYLDKIFTSIKNEKDEKKQKEISKTLIIASIVHSRINILKDIRENGIRYDVLRSDYFQNPGFVLLSMASAYSDRDMLKYILSDGISIDDVGPADNTALFSASMYGKYDNVTFLLENGSNVNYQSKTDGSTALTYAIDCVSIKNNSNVLKSDFESSLERKCHDNHAKTVEILLKAKINPSIEDNNGKTALDYAIKSGNKTIIALLNKAGAKRGKGKKKETELITYAGNDLDYNKISSAFELLSLSKKLLGEGKTVKGERAYKEGYAILKKELFIGRIIAIPSNDSDCFYYDNQLHAVFDDNTFYSTKFHSHEEIIFRFHFLTKDSFNKNFTSDKILETYEELKNYNIKCKDETYGMVDAFKRKYFWGKIEIVKYHFPETYFDHDGTDREIIVFCKLLKVIPIPINKIAIPDGCIITEEKQDSE